MPHEKVFPSRAAATAGRGWEIYKRHYNAPRVGPRFDNRLAANYSRGDAQRQFVVAIVSSRYSVKARRRRAP